MKVIEAVGTVRFRQNGFSTLNRAVCTLTGRN